MSQFKNSRNVWVASNGKEYRPLKVQVINANKLRNAAYQRPINPSKVKRIINDFRMEQVNPLKVGLREDGSYYIIDGQHTYMAITQLFGENVDISCIIVECQSKDYKNLTDEQREARVFAHQHDNTKGLSVNEKFKAAYIGGEKYAIDILHICETNEFTLNYKDGQSAEDNIIVCTNTLVNLYNKDNTGELLEKTLRVIREAYNGSSVSLQSQFIRTIGQFIHKYEDNDNFTIQKLIKALSKNIKPSQFINDVRYDTDVSKQRYGKKKSFDSCAEIRMIEAYNKNKNQKYHILLSE